MQAREILTEIYLSAEVAKTVQLLQPEHLREDIKQHVFTELFEKPDDFILDLHNRGKLKAYIAKILYNTATYQRTTFKKEIGRETPTDFSERDKWATDGYLGDGETTQARQKAISKNAQLSKYGVSTFEVDAEHKEAQKLYRDAVCAIDGLYWYDRQIFLLYLKLGTYQAVSDHTKIPRTSVYDTVQAVRITLKTKIK